MVTPARMHGEHVRGMVSTPLFFLRACISGRITHT